MRATARVLKELGIVEPQGAEDVGDDAAFPRVRRTHPRVGNVHPLSPTEIRRALRFFGPSCWYGLKAIHLQQAPDKDAGTIRLAAYRAPRYDPALRAGRPTLARAGRLEDHSRMILERAGARIETSTLTTTVSWPSGALRALMLFDGLFHEIGHHVQQRYEGKRSVRTRRTKDHERRADAFAVACRETWMHDEAS